MLKLRPFLFALPLLLSGCSLTKMVLHLKPDITDHKFFALDTLRPNPTQAPLYAHILPESEQRLPKLTDWLDEAALHGFEKGISLENFLADTKTNSLIVLHRDTVIYRRFFNGYQPNDPKIVFSVNKAITACLAAMAVQDNKMSYLQPIGELIPEFQNDGRADIRVRDLVNMTDGINWVDYKTVGWLGLMYYSKDLRKFIHNYTALKHRPGTHFGYKSITTNILGMVIESATKTHLADYLQERFWNALNMEHQGLFTKDSKKGNLNRPFGGLAMCPDDMLKMGKMLLDTGRWQGKQLLPPSFIESISNRSIKPDQYWGYDNCFWRNGYVGDGFLKGKDYFAAGYRGNYVYVSPEDDVVIIRTGSEELETKWGTTVGRLARALSGKGNDLTHPEKYDVYQQFEGVYETYRGEKLVVVYKGKNKKGCHYWDIYKDEDRTTELDKLCEMEQHDGLSLSERKFGRQRRFMVTVDANNQVIGGNYDGLSTIDSNYYEKTKKILPKKYQKKSKTKHATS